MDKFTCKVLFTVFMLSLFCKRGNDALAQVTTQTFNATGANQTFVVPCGVFSATIQAWGGGGGGGGTDVNAGGAGGGGGYVSSVLAVTPGTSLTVIVGGGGFGSTACLSGSGGGAGGFGLGNGGTGSSPGASGCSGIGGGGGGGTGIMNGATILIVAGGGGGGGGGETNGSFAGVGGAAGQNGTVGNSAAAGILGASGSTVGGSGATPGTDNPGGGGGGGGLQGGTAGGLPTGGANTSGGGGGGGATSMGTTITYGAGTTPGNSGALGGICATCAAGGTGAPGGNGVLTVTFNKPPPITGTITTSPGTCGIATATVTPSGGTPGYTYTWSPIGGNAAASTNLTNGSYTVTIADANGCTGTASTNIVLPPALTITATSTSVTCNGLSNGGITATASNGTAPYTFGLSTTPPQISATGVYTGLPAGAYTVGVQDAAGCQAIFPITITQPTPLTVTTTQTNVACFGGATGIAMATPAGGTAGYTYSWSPVGGTAATANNLPAQNYTVTVKDANLCTTTSTFTITQPPALTLTAVTTSVTCNGLANGSATVTAGGGTAGYTYSWTPVGGTATTANNLSAQNYTVTVKDANLCTATATTSITQPPVLTLTAVTTSVTCFGLSNGSATATATGGTGPTYTVGVIAPPQGGITTSVQAVSGLAAGAYTMGVQDGNGCQAIFPITIAQPATAVSATTTHTNVTCFGLSTGSASATPAGGTPGYTYTWSPVGGNAALASNIPAQNYTVTVADANLCVTTATLTITQPPAFIASIVTQTNVSCFGGNNGAATATVTGGTGPFTYNWTPMGGTALTASNLTAQVYTITATDAHNCPATATVNITQPPLLTLTATTTDVTCNGLATGSATATATGGTGPYTVGIVTPPQGGVTVTGVEVLTGLAAGLYTCGVQDALGCTAIFPITINQPNKLTVKIVSFKNDSCFGNSNGNAVSNAAGGTTPYTYLWNTTPAQTTATASNLAADPYTVTVTDAKGCVADTFLIITQPPVLTLSVTTIRNDSCFGQSNGSVLVGATGGTPAYTYSWSPIGGTTATASNLPAGNYTATVTDIKGCVTNIPAVITQPPVLTVSSVPKTICISNTANLTASATGGNTAQPYIYSIAGSVGNTVAVSPITTTVYTLSVLDIKGCFATNTITVFVRNPLSFLAVSPGAEMCNGFSTSLNATGSGGDSTFMYTWIPGGIVGQNIVVNPTATTTYTVILTDACGTPSVTANVTVTIDSLPKITFNANNKSGCYPLCVQFTSTTQLSQSHIQSYAWDLGNGKTSTVANPSICYPKSGVYSIDVTAVSDKGCVSHDTIRNMITVYSHPVANFYYNPQTITILDPMVEFTSTSTPSGDSLLWYSFGDGLGSTSTKQNPVHIYQDTGTYCVNLIATNANNCKDTTQQCIIVKPYFTMYVPNAFSPNNDGINDNFYAVAEYIKDFDMKIFDRWGNVVFHSTDINNQWTGTKHQEDVYIVLIDVTDTHNKPHTYHGTVTLIK